MGRAQIHAYGVEERPSGRSADEGNGAWRAGQLHKVRRADLTNDRGGQSRRHARKRSQNDIARGESRGCLPNRGGRRKDRRHCSFWAPCREYFISSFGFWIVKWGGRAGRRGVCNILIVP